LGIAVPQLELANDCSITLDHPQQPGPRRLEPAQQARPELAPAVQLARDRRSLVERLDRTAGEPELGGAPRSNKNLWPEPWSQARKSDPRENAWHRMVCGGTLTLRQAQKLELAYKRAHG
jgi:hypothetical protein